MRRWRANVTRGSEANAGNYWRMLELFLERMRQTPKGLLALPDKELGELLEDYVVRFEEQSADSPLIIPLQPKRSMDRKEKSRKERLAELGREWNVRRKSEARQPFIRTPNISDLIAKPMRVVGMDHNPPYIWRSYFQSHADMAAGLPKDWREFFVGHTGEISAEYTTHKRMPTEKIERMRSAYEKVLPLIETSHSSTLTRVAELEQRLDALNIEKPEVVTMEDLRERSDVAVELVKAQTDAMCPGELNARVENDALLERVEQLEAALQEALAAGARVVTKVDEDSFVVEGGRVLVVGGA